jgi:hypothetical protein
MKTGGRYVPPECLFTYGLHGPISQKVATFNVGSVYSENCIYYIISEAIINYYFEELWALLKALEGLS